MKLVLYGMPCAGKTTLLSHCDNAISGAAWLQQSTNGQFSKLDEEDKVKWRIKYTQYLASLDGHIISDGHYAFKDKRVFTPDDGDIYDVFLYLYTDPQVIVSRISESEKNQKFADLSVDQIKAWQDFEIAKLRAECHLRNKDFYVLPSEQTSAQHFTDFLAQIYHGFSSYHVAIELVSTIRQWFPHPTNLSLVDGDKTLINEDSLRLCCAQFNCMWSIFGGCFFKRQ